MTPRSTPFAPAKDIALRRATEVATLRVREQLPHAAQLLGNAQQFVQSEETVVSDAQPPIRIWRRRDALLEVAAALAAGQPVHRRGPCISYRGGPAWSTRTISWAPKSAKPTVGYFPRPGRPGPITLAALHVLLGARLTPAHWGVQIARDSFVVEQEGFAVGGESTHRWGCVDIDYIGPGFAEQHEIVPGVLASAGWAVSGGGEEDMGAWIATPPGQEGDPGVVVQARAELLHRGATEAGPGRAGFLATGGENPDQVIIEIVRDGERATTSGCTPQQSQMLRTWVESQQAAHREAMRSAGWALVGGDFNYTSFQAPRSAQRP